MKTPKRKGGRERLRLAPETVRQRTIGVRLNNAELGAIQRKADSMGIPPTTWMRHAALSRMPLRPLVPELNRQAYAELARLAGNLNQLIRAAHEGRVNVPPSLLAELYAAVQAFRLELLGATHDRENH